MSFRRPVLFLVLLALILAPPLSRADIGFESYEVSPLFWPWPAAVAPDFILPYHGVIWADFASVQYTWSAGANVYHETVVTATDVGRIAAVADASGKIHSCFRAQIGVYGLRYATATYGGNWESEWVATGTNVGKSCAVGHVNGVGPIVAYIEETSTYGRVLKYAIRDSPAWYIVDIDERQSGEPLWTGVSLATDRTSAVHLVWSTGNQVRYCTGPYTDIEVVANGVNISSTSVAIARDDQPRLCYLDSGALFFAARTDTGWSVIPVLPERSSVMEMSMAVGYEDIPHIVFVTAEADDPVFLATEFLGEWIERPLTDTPTWGSIQRPSIAASSGTNPSIHLSVAWNGGGTLWSSRDIVGVPSFAVPRLRASPLGELEATVDLYSTTQYPMEGWKVALDFTAPGVMDTVSFCNTYRDTVQARTDENGTAVFHLPTGGAVAGGVRIVSPRTGGYDPYLLETSVPVANVDLEGNGSVTAADRALLEQLMGTGDPRADLNFDGTVDEDDRQLLLDHVGHDCTTAEIGPESTAATMNLHPNPTSGVTTVSWRMTESVSPRIEIYDLAGRLVRTLDSAAAATVQRSTWDGRDHAGRRMGTGVYFVRLQAGREVMLRRLVIIR